MYQNATLRALFPHSPFRQHAPSMRSGKHLCPRNEPVSQPASQLAHRDQASFPLFRSVLKHFTRTAVTLTTTTMRDHLLFSTIRKHSFLSFGKVDIYLFLCIVRPCVQERNCASSLAPLHINWHKIYSARYRKLISIYFSTSLTVNGHLLVLRGPGRERKHPQISPSSLLNLQSDRKGTADLCKVVRFICRGMIHIRGG